MAKELNINAWLRSEYQRRRTRNASYSLRSFANACHLSVGLMSQILADKRHVTPSSLRKISSGLGLDVATERKLLSFVQELGVIKTSIHRTKKVIDEDHFRLIADWHHLAILSMFEISEFSPTPHAIAKRLKLSVIVVREALDRLVRLAFLRRDGEDFVLSDPIALSTSDELKSLAIQKFHQQTLSLAVESLRNENVERRDFLSSTLAISSKNIPRAKKALRRFRDELCQLMEEGERDSVYSLNLNFFPLTGEEITTCKGDSR